MAVRVRATRNQENPMTEKARFVLEERPETDVYATDSGYVGIRQVVRGEETVILFTPDEAESVVGYLKQCIQKARAQRAPSRKGSQ